MPASVAFMKEHPISVSNTDVPAQGYFVASCCEIQYPMIVHGLPWNC